MNKIHKFKVWDKDRNEMFTIGNLFIDMYGKVYLDTLNWNTPQDRFIIMWEIGYKDKNNVEIYEDSLIKYWSIDGKKSSIHRIMWDNQKMGYILSQEGLLNDDGLWMRDWTPSRAEVINSIYEHTELLKNS